MPSKFRGIFSFEYDSHGNAAYLEGETHMKAWEINKLFLNLCLYESVLAPVTDSWLVHKHVSFLASRGDCNSRVGALWREHYLKAPLIWRIGDVKLEVG